MDAHTSFIEILLALPTHRWKSDWRGYLRSIHQDCGHCRCSPTSLGGGYQGIGLLDYVRIDQYGTPAGSCRIRLPLLGPSDSQAVPDFTVLSFYKIFRFRICKPWSYRKTAVIPWSRGYFGGGTIHGVVASGTRNSMLEGQVQSMRTWKARIMAFHSLYSVDTTTLLTKDYPVVLIISLVMISHSSKLFTHCWTYTWEWVLPTISRR